MKTRRLGSSSRRVSEIGFGGWAIGGDSFESAYGPSDDNQSRAAIRTALELGVTFFDTADIYGRGHSEALIGQELAAWPNRDQVTVATKGGINFYRPGELPEADFTPYGIANAVEQSRVRLRQDSLDLYLLMNPPIELLLQTDRVWETLLALRRAGKINMFGVSVTDAAEGVSILKAGINLDAIEVSYNIFFQDAAVELLPLAKRKKVAIVAREPLANGFLARRASDLTFAETDHRHGATAEYVTAVSELYDQLTSVVRPGLTLPQTALRFVLDHPAISVVIPGMRSPEQVYENCAASRMPSLTADERLAIHRIFFPEDLP